MVHKMVSQMAVDKVVTTVVDLPDLVVMVVVLVKMVLMHKTTKVEHEEPQETLLMDGLREYQEMVLVTETSVVTQQINLGELLCH